MIRLNFLFLIIIFLFSCNRPHSKKKKTSTNNFYDTAIEYRDQNRYDSAFRYLNKAKELFISNKDSLGIGKCLLNMAIISEGKGDYFGSQELSLRAIPYFKATDQDQIIYIQSNFNNLGITSFNLKDYSQAISFYTRSLNYLADSSATLLAQNNLANSYRKKGNYNSSLSLLKDILKQKISDIEYARALSNFAFTKWLQSRNYNASAELLKALQIREKEKDLWGQNASYAHLSDFYANKKIDSALTYANKMFSVAKILESPDDQLEALQKLIKLSPSQASKQYFDIYKKLDDSVKTARNAAKNQFALIRYETEKHKADFLKAKTENTQKQNSILKLYLVVGALITILILGYLLYRKRKKRLQQEKELEVKNTELKYSKKVHDRVANKIYHVMSVVENTDELNKDDLLDNLEVIYDISRDISYDNQHAYVESNFEQQVSKLLQSYASEKVKISTTGNETQLWQAVNPRVRSEIYCVLQELMTNMKKHSKADEVKINFEERNHQIFISYFDNGKGIKEGTQHNNGLTNTGNRIKSINGTINFDTEVEKGLKIQIYFPIS